MTETKTAEAPTIVDMRLQVDAGVRMAVDALGLLLPHASEKTELEAWQQIRDLFRAAKLCRECWGPLPCHCWNDE